MKTGQTGMTDLLSESESETSSSVLESVSLSSVVSSSLVVSLSVVSVVCLVSLWYLLVPGLASPLRSGVVSEQPRFLVRYTFH